MLALSYKLKYMKKTKVWFVTGASKGLGLSLTKQLLEQGYSVAATSRSKSSLIKEVGEHSKNFLPLQVDLENEESIREAIAQTLAQFNTIDVVVNNAGYGQLGTLEELSNEEARQNFDVNVFGLLNVIRNILPHFRTQRSGHVFNISSIGGFTAGFAGWGIYCATKFAVAGLTEALAAEVKSLGIKVTLVYPGYFRTNFLAKDSVKVPANPIADYEEARQSQKVHQNDINGNQQNDPEKAAKAFIKISELEQAPLHLFLGEDALSLAQQKIENVQTEISSWKELTISTAFAN
jgi:NAD(P)-dependent dehydrogenase (short-subunit alcohol dehydrogenase family)